MAGACDSGAAPPPTTRKAAPPPTTKPKPPPTTAKPLPPVVGTGGVVVVGSGPGAIAAAVSAADTGAETKLVTHDAPVLGGQLRSVGRMDVKGDDADYGPYREFLRRSVLAAAPLGLDRQEILDGKIPPEVVESAASRWLADYNVEVIAGQVTSVSKSGRLVTGVTAKGKGLPTKGRHLPAAVVVDGTEWGDVMALGGTAHRLGLGRSDWGTIKSNDCLQDLTWPVLGSTTSRVKSTGKIVPIPRNENPLVKPIWDTVEPHARYRELASPGNSRRSGWNHATSDVTVRVSDVLSNRKSLHQRAAVAAMNYAASLQAMADGPNWGLHVGSSREEWPLIDVSVTHRSALTSLPYVREGRRLVGAVTLTSADMKRVKVPGYAGVRDATQDPDAIAIGNYSSDLHGCPGANDPEEPVKGDIQDGYTSDYGRGPFSVPFNTMIPLTDEGLVVTEKNISTTRAPSGAVRLQPIAFSTGVASGTTAGLASVRKVSPRQVPSIDVQWRIANTWDTDLSIQPWTDARPTTREQAFVEVATARGWMVGVASDRAGHTSAMKRGRAVELLAKAKGLTPAKTSTFSDSTGLEGRWLSAARADGWFNGCGQNRSCANRDMTRMEAAYLHGALFGPCSGARTPSDVSTASQRTAAGSAVASGDMAFCDNGSAKFCPSNRVDRISIGRIGARLLEMRTR